MTKSRPRRMQEQLVSLRTQVGLTLHAYMITTRPGTASEQAKVHEVMGNQLCQMAEAEGWSYLPLLLSTQLPTGGEVVREILQEYSDVGDDAQAVLDGKKTHFHIIFAVPTHSDEDEKLMELH
jgi:hypothetical protein